MQATAIVFRSIVRNLVKANQELRNILQKGKLLAFKHVRKFALCVHSIEMIETLILGAMQAPSDQVFYQDSSSEDWQILNRHLVTHDIEDMKKFEEQMND